MMNIEEQWVKFARSLPKPAQAAQLHDMRVAFYAGAGMAVVALDPIAKDKQRITREIEDLHRQYMDFMKEIFEP